MHWIAVRCAFAQWVWYACLSSQANLPPGMGTEWPLTDPRGKAFIRRGNRILKTYGAETNLGNKLSSNNQIIHVSESNNGGMQAAAVVGSLCASLVCLWTKPCYRALPLWQLWSQEKSVQNHTNISNNDFVSMIFINMSVIHMMKIWSFSWHSEYQIKFMLPFLPPEDGFICCCSLL